MAGTKRKASGGQTQEIANKARRTSPVELKPRGLMNLDLDVRHAYDVTRFLNNSYNLYVQFAEHASARSTVHRTAVAVDQRLDRVRQLLTEMNETILQEEVELENAVIAFQKANLERRHWFLEGNVLSKHAEGLVEGECD